MTSKVSKSRHGLTIDRHRFHEQLLRAHPKAVIAVFLPVDDEFFLGFAVQSHADDGVLLAFVVAVTTEGYCFIHRGPSYPLHRKLGHFACFSRNSRMESATRQNSHTH